VALESENDDRAHGTGHVSTTLVAPDQLTALTGPIFEGHIGLQFHASHPNTFVSASQSRLPPGNDRSYTRWGSVLHGRVAASVGATIALNGRLCNRGNNNTDFLRASQDGILTAEATPLYQGRTRQIWRVTITDNAGPECAHGQVRLQNQFVNVAEFLRPTRRTSSAAINYALSSGANSAFTNACDPPQ
jgi:1,4-dihydroxy-2-naphthoyl-CoA hydrolase